MYRVDKNIGLVKSSQDWLGYPKFDSFGLHVVLMLHLFWPPSLNGPVVIETLKFLRNFLQFSVLTNKTTFLVHMCYILCSA